MPANKRPIKRQPAIRGTVSPEPRHLPLPPFLVIVGLLFLVLLFRRPDALLTPQFWAEDGSTFFKDQLLTGLSHSLLREFMGYLHFVPRLVAGFASWFPIAFAPLLYNFWATLLAAMAFSLFALPAYRFLIRPDYLRIAVCLISAGVFSAPEVLGTITNSQWFLSIGALLLLFYPVTERWAGSLKFQLISGTAGLIVVCTSPQTLIFLPFVLWKLRPFHRRRSIGPGLVIVGMMLQICVLLSPHAPSTNYSTKSFLETVSVILAAPVYRCVMGNFIGDVGTASIAARTSTVSNLGAIVVLALWLVWLFRRCTGPVRWSVLIAVYTMFASIGIVAVRRSYGYNFDLSLPWRTWGDGRYTLLGSVLIVYLAALTLEQLAGLRGELASAFCLLALFAYGLQDHYSVPAFTDLNWPAQARQIESWMNATGARGTPSGLLLQLNPVSTWSVYLPARLSAASPQSPWEGCLVRGQGIFGTTDGVYWIQRGRKLPVTPDWVKARGLRWDDDARMIPQSVLDTIPGAR